jgi:hypothetical protein
MIKKEQIKKSLVLSILISVLAPSVAQADFVEPPVLVVDKCPEFCPPGWKPLDEPIVDKCPEFCPGWEPPVEFCAQVLIPVAGEPGAYYTDSCMKNVIREPLRVEQSTPSNNDSVKDTVTIPDPSLEVLSPPLPLDIPVCGLPPMAYEEPPYNLLDEVNRFIASPIAEPKKQSKVKKIKKKANKVKKKAIHLYL